MSDVMLMQTFIVADNIKCLLLVSSIQMAIVHDRMPHGDSPGDGNFNYIHL
jgi:hypothetical protein